LHSPEQQVLLSLHTSPVWTQKEAPSLQTPPWHKVEQHWPLSVHGLPAVRHEVLSGWQTPPLQFPPQHAAEAVQAWLSATQLAALHRPAAHTNEQHSVGDWQPPPGAVHWLIDATQVALAGSQSPEQQSCPLAHCWPKARQKIDGEVSPG
jgi:hypothetical protein